MRRLRGEDGDIIISWLIRLVLTVAVLALVVFEAGAVAFAHLGADDAAGEVARAGEVAYRAAGSLAAAQDAAEDVARSRDVDLVTFEHEGATLVVEVERQAQTLVLHRIPALAPVVTRVGERRADIGN